MTLRAAARTDVGRRRPANEDAVVVAPELGLYLVADGMGGHRAGQVASELAARAVLSGLRGLAGAARSPQAKLAAAVAGANAEILATARAKPELTGMGTTVVALLADQGRVAIAHVGDSRAYRLRGGAAERLTDDHTLVADLVRRGELGAAAAAAHPQRHVLTRALGVRRALEPDLAELAPEAGDVYLLCSDGLTGHVADEELAGVAASAPDLDAACERLVALANRRGGEDNVSVLLVAFDPEAR